MSQSQKAPPPVDYDRIREIVSEHKGEPGVLIPVLQEVQEEVGYIPPESMSIIAKGLGTTPAQVQGVLTFYAMFYTAPRGRHVVRVCRGTACHVRGGANILRAVKGDLGLQDGETDEDYQFTLETVACMGACALSPVMVVGNDFYGRLNPARVGAILDGYKGGTT
ncbi:MAG: NADH-quinone oxidoreductase subunit NuoE [Proteobacteria bacterium]|nr:NADH-quinone oxidoreductase subunit NuoE [Pseudomonadota bacterium]